MQVNFSQHIIWSLLFYYPCVKREYAIAPFHQSVSLSIKTKEVSDYSTQTSEYQGFQIHYLQVRIA